MSERTAIVGNRIKTRRMKKGLSQRALAESVGISQAHMSNIEYGRSHVTLENLFALHDILDVSMASFFVDIDGGRDVAENSTFIDLSDMIDSLLLIKNNKLSLRALK